jgi:hypothetical protein
MKPKKAKKSGRAATDERGNTVWEWQTATGTFKHDIDTQQLKRLQNDELSVTDTSGSSQVSIPMIPILLSSLHDPKRPRQNHGSLLTI